MSVINWQVNALRWLSLLVLAMILFLSGCGISSQSATHLNPDSALVETPVPAPESTVELAPVTTSTEAIIPASEVKDLPTAELTDVADSQPEEALKLVTGDRGANH
jgi:multidrug efflux pump subunit AcrA (membrane-fusion protein)